MSLAETQRTASAVSPSAVVNGLVLAPLHPNVNYWAQKEERGVCLSQWAKSILIKQMFERAWDLSHGNKTRSCLSLEVPIIPTWA